MGRRCSWSGCDFLIFWCGSCSWILSSLWGPKVKRVHYLVRHNWLTSATWHCCERKPNPPLHKSGRNDRSHTLGLGRASSLTVFRVTRRQAIGTDTVDKPLREHNPTHLLRPTGRPYLPGMGKLNIFDNTSSSTWNERIMAAPVQIYKLSVAPLFDCLSEQEKRYSHYLSRAAWSGTRIILRQVSPESLAIFNFILELYRTCRGDWKQFFPRSMGLIRKKYKLGSNIRLLS